MPIGRFNALNLSDDDDPESTNDDDDDASDDDLPPMPGTAPGGYVRQPAMHGSQIALVAEGDIWLANVPAHDAQNSSSALFCARLTTQGGCSHPHFSPDGQLLAYSAATTSEDGDGQSEVYVVAARGNGAAPRRLTHLGEGCDVVGWSVDGSHVLFRTSAEQPMSHLVQLWMVSAAPPARAAAGVAAARPSPLNVGVSHHLVSLTDGSYILGRYTADPAHAQWKGYRGGATGQLWHGRRGGTFVRIPLPEEWNVGEPCTYGGRLYFDGCAMIWVNGDLVAQGSQFEGLDEVGQDKTTTENLVRGRTRQH